jgi:hypothetical protein
MKNTNNLRHRVGSALQKFYFNTLLPILDDAANTLSPWDKKMLVPTSVQSTSYYIRRKDRSRF